MFEKIKIIKDECPICETERNLHYGIKHEKLNVRGEKIEVESKVYYCTSGDHFFADISDEEEKFEIAYREYRRRKGLLQPEDIKKIRSKYRLSQRDFASLLGFGEISIQRYESGAIQDDAHNNSIFLIMESENFRRLYEQRKKNLPTKVIQKIESRLKELEDEKRQLVFNFVRKEQNKQSNIISLNLYKDWVKDNAHIKYRKSLAKYFSQQQRDKVLAYAA